MSNPLQKGFLNRGPANQFGGANYGSGANQSAPYSPTTPKYENQSGAYFDPQMGRALEADQQPFQKPSLGPAYGSLSRPQERQDSRGLSPQPHGNFLLPTGSYYTAQPAPQPLQAAQSSSQGSSGLQRDQFGQGSPRAQEPLTEIQESTGLNFDFNEKLNDSTASIPFKDGSAFANPNTGFYYGNPATSNYVDGAPRENQKSTALFEGPGDPRGAKIDQSSRVRIGKSANRDQIEFGDVSDKQAHLIQQNRELKDLVIRKQNQVNALESEKLKLEHQLNNIMDPLSKNSELKEVAAD